MEFRQITPSQLVTVANGSQSRESLDVIFRTVGETPSRLFWWDGEKHVPLLSYDDASATQALVSRDGLWAIPASAAVFGTNVTTQAETFGSLLNAAYGHWSLPNIVNYGGVTYIGHAANDGSICVSHIGDATPTSVTRARLGKFEEDDHNVPALISRDDGLMLVGYARHGLESKIRLRIGGSAGWGDEFTVETSDRATYVQFARAPGYPSIYMFYRVGSSSDGAWAFRRSTDGGETWTPEIIIINKAYIFTVLNAGGTNLRVAAYDHPVSGTDHDIYYFSISLTGGSISIPGGTTVGNTGLGVPSATSGLPLNPATLHKAVDVSGSTSTRLLAVNYASAAILAAEFTNDSDCSYYRYLYASAGVPFTKKLVKAAGAPFLSSAKYFGGACFLDSSADTVFVSYESGGTWKIDKMVTADAGTTWTPTNLVTAAVPVVRPYMFSATKLAYTEFSSYSNFDNFAGVVKVVNV